MSEKKILYGSDEAAKFITGIKGWVDSKGRYFGDNEHMARYSGCTHIACGGCDKSIPVRGYTICDECRSKKNIEKYNEMPRKDWDRKTPLYSNEADLYFFDEDDLVDYLEDRECSVESLRLIICEPNEFREIDGEYFCDELPEDGELPDELEKAVEVLNKVILSLSPASWSPGKYAADKIKHDNDK